jgi:hypothetical protein
MAPRAKRRIIDDPPLLAPPLHRIFLRRMAEVLDKMPVTHPEPPFHRNARALAALPERHRAVDADQRMDIERAEIAFALSLLRASGQRLSSRNAVGQVGR